MTVLFHLEGNTNVANESIMSISPLSFSTILALTLPVYIGVFAYGESRFDLTFNPCNAQIYRFVSVERLTVSGTKVLQSLPYE